MSKITESVIEKYVDDKDKDGNIIGKKIVYGFAKYMRDALPNATYLGFTGTTIESTDVTTPAVFGNYVDVYDIAQAVEDGATVRIYYESRLAKIALSAAGKKLVKKLVKELDEEIGTDELSTRETDTFAPNSVGTPAFPRTIGLTWG
nr:type I restriction endonuclease subunit R [Sediminispirochaeta smaragdinae]